MIGLRCTKDFEFNQSKTNVSFRVIDFQWKIHIHPQSLGQFYTEWLLKIVFSHEWIVKFIEGSSGPMDSSAYVIYKENLPCNLSIDLLYDDEFSLEFLEGMDKV